MGALGLTRLAAVHPRGDEALVSQLTRQTALQSSLLQPAGCKDDRSSSAAPAGIGRRAGIRQATRRPHQENMRKSVSAGMSLAWKKSCPTTEPRGRGAAVAKASTTQSPAGRRLDTRCSDAEARCSVTVGVHNPLPCRAPSFGTWGKVPMWRVHLQHIPLQTVGTAIGACRGCWRSRCQVRHHVHMCWYWGCLLSHPGRG